ncbi:thioredoxin [Algoriphagus zhangzhouensis]|uniref:Thioredoxin n=2 Tax=Algoriphagus zhangzhouensis TaxID=1073327 RepID=A0A1M7Z3F1_9BACT|nr:thioredoxin [Algoriphagus zhangzhouensis]SHO59374.1 Thioredoxin [Algoriphagus zhangzhouensis]
MMKKSLGIGLVLLTLFAAKSLAQGVDFLPISYEEALEKAQAEDKLLFVDFYTVWCSPCKQMEKKVFPEAEVGELYNKEFINIKLDAEREGKVAAEKFEVNSYPTFLFINGDGEMIFKDSGSQPIASMIAMGEKANILRTSDMNLVSLQKLYPEKKDNEQFLRLYIDKIIEYGQDPHESIEAWLSIQKSIEEDDVDMMEFLMDHQQYLLVDGKAEQILEENFDEFMSIATKMEEKTLSRMKNAIVKNTKEKALEDQNPELYLAFMKNWEELPENFKRNTGPLDFKMEYNAMVGNAEEFNKLAVTFMDSLQSLKTVEEIKTEDEAFYQNFKEKYLEKPSLMGEIMLKNYEEGRTARSRVSEISRVGSEYLRLNDGKKESKQLQKWIDYGYELLPDSYLLHDLQAELFYKFGDKEKALAYKEMAINNWPEKDKILSTKQDELAKMKQD